MQRHHECPTFSIQYTTISLEIHFIPRSPQSKDFQHQRRDTLLSKETTADEYHSAFQVSNRCPSDSRESSERMPPWNQWKWEEQQDDDKWSLPSSGKTRSTRKWDWSSTPTEKSSTWYPQENRDWQSPTGQGQETFSKEGLPNESKPSREFLDSREVLAKPS